MYRSMSVLLIVMLSSGCAGQFATNVMPPDHSLTPYLELQVLDDYLAQRIDALEAHSGRLHSALDSVRRGTIRVFVGTPGELKPRAAWRPDLPAEYVGEVASLADSTGVVRELVVQVDLKRIWPHTLAGPRTWFSTGLRQKHFDAHVDAVLIHELWGHLVPLALAGTMRGWCADPTPGEKPLQSCVMQRENALRAELSLATRSSYVVQGSW